MLKEGYFDGCLAEKCTPRSCCNIGVAEDAEDYRGSPREKMIQEIKKLDIKFENWGDKVYYEKCLEKGVGCKFEKLDIDEDIRPLRCKVHPLKMAKNLTGEGDLWSIVIFPNEGCSAAAKIDSGFIEQSKRVIKDYYRKQFGISMTVFYESDSRRVRAISTAA